MKKSLFGRKKKDFIFANRDYFNLSLYIYTISIIFLITLYFILKNFFLYENMILLGIISVLIGIYLIYNKEVIIKNINDKMLILKIKKRKSNEKKGLKNSIKRMSPKKKSKLKLKIGGNKAFKDKFENLKSKFNPKKSKQKKGYLEFK